MLRKKAKTVDLKSETVNRKLRLADAGAGGSELGTQNSEPGTRNPYRWLNIRIIRKTTIAASARTARLEINKRILAWRL
jgi:hypothetical protein